MLNMIKYIFTVFLLILLVSGCAYRATYYQPVANAVDDHIQRSQTYIHRGSIEIVIWTQENSDSTWLMLSNESVNNSISITSHNFYISGSSKNYNPTELRVVDRIGDKGDFLNTEVVNGEVLVIEFQKEIQNLESFTLHLPDILNNNGIKIENLSSITFNKVTSWRAISIN